MGNDKEYIFNLPDMHDLYCYFESDINEVAIVKIFDQDMIQRYLIYFINLAYVRCPIWWQGATFRLATISEQTEFLSSVSAEIKQTWTSRGWDVETKFYKHRSLYLIDVTSQLNHTIQFQFLAKKAELEEIG